MNSLAAGLEEYLAIRHTLGVQLRVTSRLLRGFVTFVTGQGSDVVTRALAVRWAMQPDTAQPATWAWRLGMVRRFAAWRQATDSRTEVPPMGVLPYRYRRRPPQRLTDSELRKVLALTAALPSPRGLRGLTYATLFGLLAVTGLRISEAIALDTTDVARDAALLTIRRTKFGKSRLVPVHPSTVTALARYAETRDRVCPRPASPAFFVSERGRRLTDDSARHTFALVGCRAGLRTPPPGRRHGRGPRLHDLRHHFAVSTLLDWYQAGRDVERDLPKLATYLGHVHVRETYWYLEAVPELLAAVATRLTSALPERLP